MKPPRTTARGWHRREPGKMNKLEAEYAAQLAQMQRDGLIQHFEYEGVKLRLADKTYYTPDFFVVRADGLIEFHEVKGFWAEHNRVKIKVAAEQKFWARFFAITKEAKKRGGGWKYEEF